MKTVVHLDDNLPRDGFDTEKERKKVKKKEGGLIASLQNIDVTKFEGNPSY